MRFVQMQALLDAMDTRTGPARFFLDTETGDIDVDVDGDGSGEDAKRWVELPRRPAADARAVLTAFIASIGDHSLRERLLYAQSVDEQAGASAQPARAVAAALAGDPVTALRLQRQQREAALQYALDWLRTLGFEPNYELPPLDAAPPAPPLRFGLFELLLLGEPLSPHAGTPRLGRRVTARDPEQARTVFEHVARDLLVRAGEPIRPDALAHAQVISVAAPHPTTITVNARAVELVVALPAALQALLHAEPPTEWPDADTISER